MLAWIKHRVQGIKPDIRERIKLAPGDAQLRCTAILPIESRIVRLN